MVYSPLQGRLAQRESAAFTRQRSLVRTQHRPLSRYFVLQGKRKGKEELGTCTWSFLHQSDNRGPYGGWRRTGARPGGWAGAPRDGGFGIGRVTGSSSPRVMVAPWCATSSGAPWSRVYWACRWPTSTRIRRPRKQRRKARRESRRGSRGAKLSEPPWSRMPPNPATAAIQAPAREARWIPSRVLWLMSSRSSMAAS